jgi:GNAT superfamily N-acetyltransferase
MLIRPATDADAVAAADLLRRSIRELCVQDHANDGPTLDAWLANKTPETFREWLAGTDQTVLVAERDGALVAIGCFRRPDELLLNYVAPEARFSGVSKAMLAALEAGLMAAGARQARLVSTRTAHAFYHSAGYREAGRAGTHGMSVFDMIKDLQP